jgi:hypothetical protein
MYPVIGSSSPQNGKTMQGVHLSHKEEERSIFINFPIPQFTKSVQPLIEVGKVDYTLSEEYQPS